MPRYPKGVTKDAAGWPINLGPGGSRFRKRFPASLSQEKVEAAPIKARSRLRAGTRGIGGTFSADVITYLTSYYQGKPGYEERARPLGLWTVALGSDTRRADVTREDVSRVLHGWNASGLSGDTCNKRRTALLAFYNALEGKSGPNPAPGMSRSSEAPQRCREPSPMPSSREPFGNSASREHERG